LTKKKQKKNNKRSCCKGNNKLTEQMVDAVGPGRENSAP